MKRYSEYKDCGVKWIGEIPEHWEIRRLKNVVLCNAETLSENFPKDEVIKYVEISDVNYTSGITNIQRMPFGEAPSRARRITKKNDVIVSTVRTYLKAVAKIQEDGLIVSTGFAVLHPLIGNSSFLSYFALSESFIHNVIVNSKGISYPAITASDLICIAMPLPPLSEQEAIVTYLDTKVAKIDEYISIAEKKIAALEELKQTIIAEAVTRGIHKDVPMKDSGVKWIGMIPEHWKVNKIRSHFKERRVKVSDKDFQALSVAKIGIVPQLEDACKTDNGDNRKQVLKGDFVVNSRSDRKGSCGISPLDGSVSLINIVLRPFNILQEYVHYLFRSHNYIEEFYRNGRGIVADLWTTRYSEMRNIQIPVPPLYEQQEIVTYLDSKVANINQLCQAERSQIEKLKEYKQRLISDVVTGKVKVTND